MMKYNIIGVLSQVNCLHCQVGGGREGGRRQGWLRIHNHGESDREGEREDECVFINMGHVSGEHEARKVHPFTEYKTIEYIKLILYLAFSLIDNGTQQSHTSYTLSQMFCLSSAVSSHKCKNSVHTLYAIQKARILPPCCCIWNIHKRLALIAVAIFAPRVSLISFRDSKVRMAFLMNNDFNDNNRILLWTAFTSFHNTLCITITEVYTYIHNS